MNHELTDDLETALWSHDLTTAADAAYDVSRMVIHEAARADIELPAGLMEYYQALDLLHAARLAAERVETHG